MPVIIIKIEFGSSNFILMLLLSYTLKIYRIVYKVIPNHSDYKQSGLLADPLDQDVQQVRTNSNTFTRIISLFTN